MLPRKRVYDYWYLNNTGYKEISFFFFKCLPKLQGRYRHFLILIEHFIDLRIFFLSCKRNNSNSLKMCRNQYFPISECFVTCSLCTSYTFVLFPVDSLCMSSALKPEQVELWCDLFVCEITIYTLLPSLLLEEHLAKWDPNLLSGCRNTHYNVATTHLVSRCLCAYIKKFCGVQSNMLLFQKNLIFSLKPSFLRSQKYGLCSF